MRVIRSTPLLALMAALTMGFASAAPVPKPSTSSSERAASSPKASSAPTAAADEASPARDGGTIDGHVSSIDFHSGKMTVDVGEGESKKSYDILVVPGTSIRDDKDFDTIADLKKGAHVQVLISRHGSTNTAQIIRLL